MLAAVLAFVVAHIVAWLALGGGWRGAGRAPLAVFVPASALMLLDAIFFESYSHLGAQIITLVSWEALYFFLYVCLRIVSRPAEPRQALPRR
ncbi:hypothetical protein [Hyphomicrobium sp.]|uniref:hypothetical protein n=1 Tax=Hyphomicrobium sp. TaxID=82 RepID=UPI002FDE3D9D